MVRASSSLKIDDNFIATCMEISDGIMNQGLVMTLKKIFNAFRQVQLIYDLDPDTFIFKFYSLDLQINIMDQDKLYNYLVNILEVLRDFLLKKS